MPCKKADRRARTPRKQLRWLLVSAPGSTFPRSLACAVDESGQAEFLRLVDEMKKVWHAPYSPSLSDLELPF
jgi:hypothetical protein